MTYQDLKVRDTLRILAIVALAAAIFAILLVYRTTAEPVLDGLQFLSSRHDFYWIVLAVSGSMTILCLGVAMQYLVTSPAQNAIFIQKAKKPMPPSLLETGNPNYNVPTWRYLLAKSVKR